MFDLNQLRCFVTVTEERHFGRAATRLNMTQPPLSRQIQVLERVLGVTLLDRTSRSVQLTRAGSAFLPEAQRILKMAETASQFARRVSIGQAGSLKIAFTAASAYNFLPELVKASTLAMPDIDLFLEEMVTRDQIDALLSGATDIGLMRPPITRSELRSLRVQAEPLLGVVPDGHRLASAEALTLKDFDDEPFVMYAAHEARYFHDLVVALFSSAKVLPRYFQHLSQIHSILSMVRAGVGCTVVPQSASAIRYEGVHYKPLRLKQPACAELYMVWRRDRPNPMVERMLALAQTL
jgi:DNA-binding transcriptional LysR family regulator